MTEDKALCADDIPWFDALDEGEDHVEEEVESEAIIKRRFNAKVREIEGKTSDREDKTLSEIEVASDWMATEASERYLHADDVGWKRYEFGRWRDGEHDIYQDITEYIRGRVEATNAARTLNKHSVVRSVMAHVAEHRAVPADSFDANPLLVAYPDGTVLDVGAWTHRKATKEDKISILSFDGLATNNPPHGRITSETVGVVYVLITTKATKHRLTELPRHAVPSVLAGTAVLENSPGNLGQAKGIIKLPIGQQPAVRGDLGPVKFQLQAAVEIDPKSVPFRFTHRMCHLLCPLSPLSI